MAVGQSLRYVCAALVVATGIVAPAPAQFACPNPAWQPFNSTTASFPGADSWVLGARPWDSDGPGPKGSVVVVHGGFELIGGTRANHVAVYDPATGVWASLGGGTNEWVTGLTTRPNGEVWVTGPFTEAGGIPAPGFAMWNGSAWNPVESPWDSGISALTTMPNGDVVAAGYIFLGTDPGTGEDLYEQNLQRWNGATWLDLGAHLDPAAGEFMQSLTALPNGDLIVGGFFQSIAAIPASNLARLSGSTWSEIGGGTDGEITIVARTTNGDLYVGGAFAAAGGVPANNIARWNGSSWTALGSGVQHPEYAALLTIVPLPNGDLAVGGYFSEAGGVPSNGIARWKGSSWESLAGGVVGGVRAIASLPNGDLIAGGLFDPARNNVGKNLARWNGTSWSTFGTGFDEGVYVIHNRPNGDVAVGGYFSTVSGLVANGVARWDGSEWHTLGTGLGGIGIAFAMADLPNGDLVVGGTFTEAGGVSANSIAKWSGSGWSNLGEGVTGSIAPLLPPTVSALAVMPSGDLIAGGNFYNAGSVPARFIARWDGTDWSMLGDGLSGDFVQNEVSALAVLPNGRLVAGGDFFYDGGVVESFTAQWDGATWSGLGSDVDLTVYALKTLVNGDLVVAGRFYNAGSIEARSIARWDGSQWHAFGAGVDGDQVFEVAELSNGDVVAAGLLYTAGGDPVKNIARWDGSQWHAMGGGTSGTYTSGVIAATSVLADGSVAVGGYFAYAGEAVAPFIAVYGCQAPACYADCDASGSLDIDDFICFQTLFAIGSNAADCDATGSLDIDDFICFQTLFALGC